MLPWLVSLSEAAYADAYGRLPKNAKGAFDYCYATKKGNCISITGNTNKASEGTRVYFRIYDEKSIPGDWTMLKHSSRSWSGTGWKITYGADRQAYPGVLQSFYEITNNAGRDFYFDLAFYTPINFGQNGTHARLFMAGKGDAIGIDGGNKQTMYFHVKKTPWSMHNNLYDYLGSVDSTYIGPTKEEKDLPVLDNTYDNEYLSPENVNSAMGFAWKKHLLKKGDVHRFGFKVQITDKFIRLPLIKDITPFKETYPDPFTVILNVTGYGNTPVEAKLGFSSQNYYLCGTFTPKSDMETATVNCTIYFGDKNVSNYKPIAIQNGHKGWEARYFVKHVKDGTMRPTLKLKTKPKDSYSASDPYIFIDGEVDDEHYVNINYQFDSGEEVVGQRFITSQDFETLPFEYNIPFPTDLEFGAKHIIKIWVTDDNGLWSDPVEKEFMYEASDKPIVRNIYISEERLLQKSGETRLVFYGEGIYTKEGKTANVYLRVDDSQEEHLLTTFEAKKEPVPIAGFYNFTANEASHHKFTVYARDSEATQNPPESPVTAPLIVWDPSSAQASSDIGKFIDTTLKIDKSVTTLFNLEYQDVNQNPWQISANNEGFYCKFRTYGGIDTTSKIGEYDFTHTSEGKMNKDGFDIQFKISEDPNTKFTVAKFTVKNTQFFERIFDLGLVVNSQLTDKQKTIEHINNENKIVVESNEQFVSYTLFYSQLDPKAAVTDVYLGKIDRNGKTWDKKPFFSSSKASRDLNAYGLTWAAQRIPGEGSVEFTLTFAAYGKVKSPTRLVDRKEWKQHYQKTDTETLDIEVIDADIGEELLISVNENNNIYNYSHTIDQSQHRFRPTLNFSQVGESTTYSVTVQAFDKNPQTRFPSNIINKIVYLKEPPTLDVDKLPKLYYSTRDKLETTVRITGTKAPKVDIYYRLLLPSQTGMAESAERLAQRNVPANGEKETISIPLDRDVFPLEDAVWKIKLYAKDGNLMSEVEELEFNLNAYDPPKLFRAGISKKSARVGERILGFVVVNDNQNDFLEIYVSFDKNNFPQQPAHTISKNANAGKDTPYAFYWTVPEGTESGIKDVYFLVKDSEGAPSTVAGPKTLVITG